MGGKAKDWKEMTVTEFAAFLDRAGLSIHKICSNHPEGFRRTRTVHGEDGWPKRIEVGVFEVRRKRALGFESDESDLVDVAETYFEACEAAYASALYWMVS